LLILEILTFVRFLELTYRAARSASFIDSFSSSPPWTLARYLSRLAEKSVLAPLSRLVLRPASRRRKYDFRVGY